MVTGLALAGLDVASALNGCPASATWRAAVPLPTWLSPTVARLAPRGFAIASRLCGRLAPLVAGRVVTQDPRQPEVSQQAVVEEAVNP